MGSIVLTGGDDTSLNPAPQGACIQEAFLWHERGGQSQNEDCRCGFEGKREHALGEEGLCFFACPLLAQYIAHCFGLGFSPEADSRRRTGDK